MKPVNNKPKHPNRISRYIQKEILELKSTKFYKSNRSAFLISDSQGRDLQFLKEKKYLRFRYKGGADITNTEIQQYAKHQVTRTQNKYPVILFWFGTCAFTTKNSDGIFEIKNDLDEVVDITIANYRKTKNELLGLNKRAKIIFLECLYYSLSMYNEFRGKNLKRDYFSEQQRKLVNAIDKHNYEIRLLNNYRDKAPNFNNDFSTRTNRKNRKPKKVVDYSQLRDGCHPGRHISELWLLRIHRLIYRI